jgi:phosphonoacetaldehyde hydrolase
MTFSYRRIYTGPVQAVIMDWAGTAVDYGCCAPVAVFMEVYRQREVEISMAVAREPMGLEKKDHIRAIAANPAVAARWQERYGRPLDESDIEGLFHDSVALQTESVVNYAEPIPGCLETMAYLRKKGIKTGSSTGYSRPIMERLVPVAEKLGYRPDSIVCPSDVPAGRPSPVMIYQNLSNLGVYPVEAVVKVGDTVHDIEEGLNAGAWTVQVTRSSNDLGLTLAEADALDSEILAARLAKIEEKFRRSGAHFVIPTVAELPGVIEQIEEKLRRGEQP